MAQDRPGQKTQAAPLNCGTIYHRGGCMTWEEITKKYDTERKGAGLLERAPKLEKNWNRLIHCTDKLVWLFMLSTERKGPEPKKG